MSDLGAPLLLFPPLCGAGWNETTYRASHDGPPKPDSPAVCPPIQPMCAWRRVTAVLTGDRELK